MLHILIKKRHLKKQHELRAGLSFTYRDNDWLNLDQHNIQIINRGNERLKTKISSKSKTGFRGVSIDRGRIYSKITYRKKSIHLGCFKTIEEAARAYDKKSLELWGILAPLNFPNECYEKRIYKGIYYISKNGNDKKCWVAKIRHNKKTIGIGFFKSQNDAARKRNEILKLMFGDKAELLTIIDNPLYERGNIKWFNTNNGRYFRKLSLSENIEKINSNTNEKNKEDNEKIILYLNGNEKTLEELITKYYNYWIKWLRYNEKRLRHQYAKSINRKETPFTIEDALSEGLSKIVRNFKLRRYSGLTFKGWSTRIITTTISLMYRKEYLIRINILSKNKSKLIYLENDGY